MKSVARDLILILAMFVFDKVAIALDPPGTVITHSPVSSGRYIGSPSFLITSSGEYLACHDFFGPGAHQYESGLSEIFASEDRGLTWKLRSQIDGAFYSVLFEHAGAIYLLGVDRHAGTPPKTLAGVLTLKLPEPVVNAIVIRRSVDGGRSWSRPKNAEAGLLFTGQYGFAPTPVIEHAGRLWRAQDMGMLSAPVDSDLLKASSWRNTPGPPADNGWFSENFEGWGEGNAVVAPGGQIVNLAKVRYLRPGDDHAAIIVFDPEGKAATFDARTDFVKMPGARLKFTVRFDTVSKLYWAVTNYLPLEDYGERTDLRRNTLALVSSPDLRTWQINHVLLHDPDTLHHGFQYFDFAFEGSDLVGLCRTAWPDGEGGPKRQHDANYLTFHRWQNFRSMQRPMSNLPAEF